MKKRTLKALSVICVASLLITGCGSQFPEMTQEEYDQTVQYAVSILLKHSNNGVERLSSISALELEYQINKEAREAAKAARDAELNDKIANGEIVPVNEEGEPVPDSTTAASEPEEEKPVEEEQYVAAIDATEEDDSSADTGSSEQTADAAEGNSDDDIDELLDKYKDELDEGIKNSGSESSDEAENPEEDTKEAETKPSEEKKDAVDESQPASTEADKTVDGMRQELSKGIFLTYSGYSVAGSYPDNDDVFVINATQGKKLLILNFRIANTSGMDVSVDMEKANPHFQVILNGVNVGYTNVTMLDNDLSTFKGTIPADAKLSMVLIKQMDAQKLKTVDSIGLIGDMGSETIQFNLE